MSYNNEMHVLIEKALSKNIWAVVGATDNKDKYGYKILKALKSAGYKVYAVNPGYVTVDGEVCYKSVSELPEKPNCVSIVVNPKISMLVIDDVKKSRVEYIWFQPGTFNEGVIFKAKDSELNVIYDNCVLVELRKLEK